MNSKQEGLTPMESWDAKAEEWAIQVGDEGDMNRRYQSDPVLWRMLGEVSGLTVLDAGCGTGYLAIAMARRGAQVIGVDWSPRMIAIARERAGALGVEVDLRVDSCSELATVADASVDAIVSNYVLMDLPDLEGAVASFHRVLREGGHAVAVFSHPCFGPPGGWGRLGDGSAISCAVKVFPLKVSEERKRWPERKQRIRRWYAPEEAASLVQEGDLQSLLRGFREQASG